MLRILAHLFLRTFYTCLLVSCLLATSSYTQAQRAALLEDKVAIFYPKEFQAAQHLPSLALQKEPQEQGKLPKQWREKVYFTQLGNKSVAYLPAEEGTNFYATGEVAGNLERQHTSIKLWNTDNYAYRDHKGSRLYQSHPWVLAVRKDGTAYGVLADNTWKQELVLNSGIQFSSEGPAFRVLVMEGDSPQQVMQLLGKYTGTMALPPLWSLGYQQCRWSYYPDQRVREVADTFRAKQLPVDVLWLDIHYMDAYKVFTFDPQRFPSPKSTNDYLHSLNLKGVWMIDPGVAKKPSYAVYDSGSKADIWVKTKSGTSYQGSVWPGPCVFPDFTQEKTQNWWAGLYKEFMATGIDGVWNDMNEPAVFDSPTKTMPEDNQHLGGTRLPAGNHLRYHNVYGMLMVEASRKGIQTANPDKRPFILTRSNFLGGHRYAATWTGDNEASWEHLKMSIPMSLNLGLSGQAFNGPDIGGFVGNATPDLFGHWIAMGTLFPFARAHTHHDSKNQEPWEFGQAVENAARTALERRYRLLPYLYTLFREASKTGMPVMRPTFFADPTDLRLRHEEQSFLLGADLLVVPKWAKNPQLPQGDWPSVQLLQGKKELDDYQVALKLRPGAVVPLAEVVQSTASYSLETLELMVALDAEGRATGRLYHDAGEGFGYQKGAYTELEFSAVYQNKTVKLKIERLHNDFPLGVKQLTVQLLHKGRTYTKTVTGLQNIVLQLTDNNKK